jgi:hypothetical protein
VFISPALDYVVLANQCLTTVRALEVFFVFPPVLILIAHFHVAYPLVLALSLLTTVVAAALLFLNIVFCFYALLHVIHHINIFVIINFYSQICQDFFIQNSLLQIKKGIDIGSGNNFPR